MGPILFFLTAIVGFGYILLLLQIMQGWDDTEEWNVDEGFQPNTFVSIVVAARNESKHILKCVESLLDQNYPSSLYEIIIVNDHSTDDTLSQLQTVESEQLIILNLEGEAGKKAALSLAISHSSGKLICCTDADSSVPAEWLQHVVSMYEKKQPKLIAGPIVYNTNRSRVQRFQFLDSVANMAITAAGIKQQKYYMANGANIAYEKKLFEELGGYGEDHLASGDDMMLIQKTALKYPNKILFLKSKNATITTQPVLAIKDLIQQRKRWSTKSMQYPDKGIIKVQGYVFFLIVVLLINLLLIPFTAGLSLFSFLFLLFIKWTMDFLFLNKMASYFGNTKPLKSFFSVSVWFLLYIIWAAWFAFFPSTYQWKGRSVK